MCEVPCANIASTDNRQACKVQRKSLHKQNKLPVKEKMVRGGISNEKRIRMEVRIKSRTQEAQRKFRTVQQLARQVADAAGATNRHQNSGEAQARLSSSSPNSLAMLKGSRPE